MNQIAHSESYHHLLKKASDDMELETSKLI